MTRIFEERDGPPPVAHYQNSWGRFIFRAYRLESNTSASEGLVGVTVQHQEPLVLLMMRNMHAAGLSEKQKQLCLLLGRNHSFAAIAAQLHISVSTAKDYADRVYRKLDVHTRDELMHKLSRNSGINSGSDERAQI